MAFFGKHYHSPGTAPGTLRQQPAAGASSCQVRLVRYGPSAFDIAEGTGFPQGDIFGTDANPMSVSMLDIYLSSINNHMNEIMRMLTIIATIFIPLTFIVGVYGMNFGNNGKSPWAMPELNWYYGYPLVWLLMILVTGGLLYYFRRKGWV